MFHCVMLKSLLCSFAIFIQRPTGNETQKVGDEDLEMFVLSGQVIVYTLVQSIILLYSHLSWQLDKSATVTTRSKLEHPTLGIFRGFISSKYKKVTAYRKLTFRLRVVNMG